MGNWQYLLIYFKLIQYTDLVTAVWTATPRPDAARRPLHGMCQEVRDVSASEFVRVRKIERHLTAALSSALSLTNEHCRQGW